MTVKVKNIITLSVVFVASLLLTIGTHMVFNPIKEQRDKAETLDILKNYYQTATDFESNTLGIIEGVEILRSVRVYNDQNPLGYLYEANITNDFGNMKVRISVDPKDIIQTTEFIEMNQTMYQAQTESMLATYKLTKLSTDIFDGAAGATSISKNDLSHLMSMVGKHHDSTDKFEFIEPYKDFYGDYEIESTSTIEENNAVIKIEVIKDKGTVYTITKSGIYQTDSIEEKSITMIVALDNDVTILGVLLPVELYNHTKGNFMASALAFAQSYVGESIANITDGQTGASGDGSAHNSRNLIERMMLTLQSVHIGAYASYFGNNYEISNTQELTRNGATIVVESIKDKGSVYTITKSSIYRTGNDAIKDITLIVVLDLNGKVLGMLLPTDRYNHTGGNFYQNTLQFALSYVDTNILDVTDGNAGVSENGVAFNSKSLIEDMMLIVSGVHQS